MHKDPSTEVDLFLRRALVVMLVILVTGAITLFVYGRYFDSRLDTFEEQLSFNAHVEIPSQSPESSHSTDQVVQGQTVYVPAYSHVYHQDGDPHLLTVTLSVRNTSVDQEIVIQSVRYFDTQGRQVKSHLTKPRRLSPLATAEFLVARSDKTGGSGANFLVEWTASHPVPDPIIETVMIDTTRDQGISFVRRGTVIKE